MAIGTLEKRREYKRKAVEYLGGKCELCGYNKCVDAFDFHHRDPGEKGDNEPSRIISSCAWDRIVEELDKCMLVCANCHRELHAKIRAEERSKRIPYTRNYSCYFCSKPYSSELSIGRYCSAKCRTDDIAIVGRPTKEELEKLLWEIPTIYIAEKYHVTDVMVGKWVKKFGLKKPTRGYWRVKETNKNI